MDMCDDRAALKSAVLAILGQVALEHPVGHQGKLAARYVLRSQSGERIELMFEKGPKSPPHLWMSRAHAAAIGQVGAVMREYPASDVNRVTDAVTARTIYGRHAALKSMRELAEADLVRLTPETAGQVNTILARLRAI
jgi:hypothetical protein